MSQVICQPNSSIVYLELNGQWYWYDSASISLGSGSMGTVYIGYNYGTGIPVAIKMVRAEYAGNPVVRRRARAEAGMTFMHPNILRMFGVCEDSSGMGPLFILSEYISGRTLDKYVCDVLGPMSMKCRVASLLQLTVTILDALAYIHNIGVVHRDVKPSNVMISSSGTPKLMDLGISEFRSIMMSDKSRGAFTGTPLYAAPELAMGLTVDHKVDIYAVGVMLYELILNCNPFDAASREEVLDNQIYRPLPYSSDIPDELFVILQNATAKNPDKRFSSASRFSSELNTFLQRYVQD